MDKLSKDLIQLEKVNNLIKLHMPDFARRFGTDETGFDIPTDLLEKVISEVPF